MTDEDRAEKLALAVWPPLTVPEARRALAAVDADPAAYGYAPINTHRLRADGYCLNCGTHDWRHDPAIEIIKVTAT